MKKIQDILTCPNCASTEDKTTLKMNENSLFCRTCKQVYRVTNNLPIMLTNTLDFLNFLENTEKGKNVYKSSKVSTTS